jgi:recombination protein RecA
MAKKEIVEGEDTTLEDALKKLRKEYGPGVVLSSADIPTNIEAISTGCFALDNLLGCGGLPKGRIIEIFGEPSEGKSTLCLFLTAQVQKAGGTVLYIDAENAYDAFYAKNMGVDTDKLLISQPSTLEETFDTVRAMAETKKIDLIVVDSVAALVPKSELEGEDMLKETMALQARLLGKALRIVTGPISRSNTVVIFINQTRSKVGIVWGNPETTPGGKALKFFASVRLKVSKGDKIFGANKDEQIGNTVKITAVKNKVGLPFRKAEFDLYYGSGVDLVADTIDTAEELKLIKKEGMTYFSGDTKIAVGREKMIEALRSDKKLYEEIRKTVEKAIKAKKEGDKKE